MISVIIPTYNDNQWLKLCLAALAESDRRPFEVIVVDDASVPSARDIASEYGARYIRLEINGGQSAARNEGARIARGDILFFMDADVAVGKGAVGMVEKAFERDDVFIYQGIPSKVPLNHGFGPELLSLKMYFMLKECREASYVHSHIFSIRRSVFEEMGGFDPRFKPPCCGEEFDLGHRLRRKYVIHTDPELLAMQKGVPVMARAMTLYYRAYSWAALFYRERRFENTNASFTEAMSGVCSVILVIVLVLSLLHPSFLYLAILPLLLHILIGMRFYRFLASEKGMFFMLAAIGPNMLWAFAATAGGGHYLLRRILGRAHEDS